MESIMVGTSEEGRFLKSIGIQRGGIQNEKEKSLQVHPKVATLFCLTLTDLGFKNKTTSNQLYERARMLGLELCSVTVGLTFRLKYRNQPVGENMYMGVKWRDDSSYCATTLELSNSRGILSLYSPVRPDIERWNMDTIFAFCLYKFGS